MAEVVREDGKKREEHWFFKREVYWQA